MPWLSGRWQPLHSIYARSCLEAVDNMLAGGGVVRPISANWVTWHFSTVRGAALGATCGVWRPPGGHRFRLKTLGVRPPEA